MDRPEISVIVPVYRAEAYLPRCVESLLQQTCRELEVILVDDGSPDGSGALCDAYARKDPRVRVIHQENGGVSAARNAGLEQAAGKWIGFVDGDDAVEPDMFSYLLDLARTHEADIAQCGVFFEEVRGIHEEFTAPEDRILRKAPEQRTMAEWGLLSYAVWNKLFRRELLETLRFDRNHTIGEDMMFVMESAAAARCIVLGAQAKYRYAVREDSAIHRPPTRAMLESSRGVWQEAKRRLFTFPAAAAYLEKEFLRNEMDVCSRMARFYRPEFEELRREICGSLRRRTGELLVHPGLSPKDRLKLLLIGWCWTGYRRLLGLWKAGQALKDQ